MLKIGSGEKTMDLSKKNTKKILCIITFAVVLFAISQNLSVVGSFIEAIITIFAPVIVGFSLAFMLNIPLNIIEKRLFGFLGKSQKKSVKRIQRPLSLITTLLLTCGFFALLLFIIIPQLYDTIMLIVNNMPDYYKSFIDWIENIIARFNLNISTEVLHNPRINFNAIADAVQKLFHKEGATDIINTTMGVTSSVISGVTNFALGFVIAIYILAEKEKIGNFSIRVSEEILSRKHYTKLREVCSIASTSFANFIAGQFTDAILLGFLCFIGMTIFKLPNAAVVSVIIGISALVPVIGPIVGEIIGAFIILLTNPWQALFFLVFVLILQTIDNNLIYPRIMSKSTGVPGILILIAVIVGGKVGGILGVLLGVPSASAVYAIVVNWLKNKHKEKELREAAIKAEEIPNDSDKDVSNVAEEKTTD